MIRRMVVSRGMLSLTLDGTQYRHWRRNVIVADE
jgi:hypothetical protein